MNFSVVVMLVPVGVVADFSVVETNSVFLPFVYSDVVAVLIEGVGDVPEIVLVLIPCVFGELVIATGVTGTICGFVVCDNKVDG